ncbi:ISAs1 family transposase [Escherichia coli]|nr:ISAs1 family transposase [Escherichia coli]MBW9613967.1 ISAs1 family transposase [Escherichia coli]
MASVSISCPSCSATDGVVRTDNRIARDAHYLYRYDRHGRLTEKTDLIPEGVIRTDDERTHRYHYDSQHRLVHYTRTQYAEDVIAIDGKTLRHSYDKSRRRGAIHVISAFSTMHSLVIGQIKTDKKSNEITAIPELLNMLDIKGKIITTDAMGCQKDIAEKIQKQGGDYLFAVKGNQGRLNKAFEEKFPLKELNNPEHDSYAMSEKSHGREEIRLHIVCDVPDELIDFTFEWKGLKKLCVAVSFRSIIAEQKKEPEMTVRYYISSADLTAEKFATAIRNHWHVENKLHWRLDVVMNEDDCKIRRGNAAELFSGIRHIAINILTNDKVFKAELRRKMRKAAMDRNYLASVLAGSGLS